MPTMYGTIRGRIIELERDSGVTENKPVAIQVEDEPGPRVDEPARSRRRTEIPEYTEGLLESFTAALSDRMVLLSDVARSRERCIEAIAIMNDSRAETRAAHEEIAALKRAIVALEHDAGIWRERLASQAEATACARNEAAELRLENSALRRALVEAEKLITKETEQ